MIEKCRKILQSRPFLQSQSQASDTLPKNSSYHSLNPCERFLNSLLIQITARRAILPIIQNCGITPLNNSNMEDKPPSPHMRTCCGRREDHIINFL